MATVNREVPIELANDTSGASPYGVTMVFVSFPTGAGIKTVNPHLADAISSQPSGGWSAPDLSLSHGKKIVVVAEIIAATNIKHTATNLTVRMKAS